MICWTIKYKGKGYVNKDFDYGRLMDATFFLTKAEAKEDIQEKEEEVAKIEIKELD